MISPFSAGVSVVLLVAVWLMGLDGASILVGRRLDMGRDGAALVGVEGRRTGGKSFGHVCGGHGLHIGSIPASLSF